MDPDLRGAHPNWVPTLFGLAAVVDVITPPRGATEGRIELPSLPSAHGGILGAQLLGQTVTLCEACLPGLETRSLALRFVRPSDWRAPLVGRVTVRAHGRRFGSATVTFQQNGTVIAHGDVLLSAARSSRTGEDTSCAAARRSVDRARPSVRALWPWEIRYVEDSPALTRVWSRSPIADTSLSRALLAFATESLTVPLAIDAAGWRDRGGDIAQVVVSHTITYLAPVDVRTWHLHRARLLASDDGHVTGQGDVLDSCLRSVVSTETVALISA